MTQIQAQPHQLEFLDRGLVAVKANEAQIYVTWRLLVSDSDEVGFNVYRSANGQPATRLNASPLFATTDYTDSAADLSVSNSYYVRPVKNGVELAASRPFEIAAGAPVQQYLSLPLQIPEGGTTPDGVEYSYSANDLSVGDLDGDGRYEIVVKWYPSNAKDNAQSGHTGNCLLDAYTLEGELLWRIDLGVNIRSGSHYTQFIVYDLDGDGIAELACRTAEGSMDASGAFVGAEEKWFGDRPPMDHSADRRNGSGYILDGPEFLTVFDGRTGLELSSTLYEPQRVPGTYFPTPAETEAIWGDGYGNRIDRFLGTVAYLDGERPSLVMCRGYYTGRNGIPGRTVLAAYDWRDGVLSKRWVFDTYGNPENDSYRGQGAHSVTVGDVDGDGRDEIVYGACAIDDDGTGLYNTGIGHGDALHLSDMDPDRPGLEVWMPHESPSSYGEYGSELHDAATGEVLFGVSGEGSDVGRGAAADIDPRYRGYETWASRGGVHSITGESIPTNGNPSMNFLVWWDEDPLRELLDGTRIDKWNWNLGVREEIFTDTGISSNNSTKATPNLSGDIYGDWREEVIWRSTDSSELRIYSTIIPARNRMTTLMHDRQYRIAISWQNVAYNQPPHPSFFIGEGMATPPKPDYFYASSNEAPLVELVSPGEGSIFEEGDVASLVAEAADVDGSVDAVEFFENASFLGTDLTDPYTALWDASNGGSYLLRAVATDNEGLQSVSLPVTVTVGHTESHDEATAESGWTPLESEHAGYRGDGYFAFSRPWHFIEFSELDGGLVGGEKTLRIRYSAARPGVNPCFLIVNGVRQMIQLPSTGAWTEWRTFEIKVPLDSGPVNTVRLQARGGQAMIDELTVAGVVRNQDPELDLVTPQNGASFAEGSDILIRVQAQDIGGAIASVEFFAGEVSLGSVTEAPYQLAWNGVSEGLYTLKARATDDLGASAESNEAVVLVNNPPSVAISAPSPGAYIPSGEVVTIVADADDGVGNVAAVDFFEGENLLGSDSEAPFSMDWSSEVEGPYSFSAVATDNRGASTRSRSVEVTVNPAGYSVVYQAEDATLAGDSAPESTNAGFNGTGYVNSPTEGGSILFENVDGGSGSMAILRIRYALGAAASRTGRLTVNGASQDIEFPPTGSWTTYTTMDLPFPFDAMESNSVEIESTGEDLANIDEIAVLGLQSEEDRTYHAENADAENVSLESNNAGFNGTGFYNFPSSDGVLEFREIDGGIGGSITMRVRYALGASGVRTGTLTINGVASPIDFPSTGAWTSYQFIELNVSLLAGPQNTIRIASIGNDLGNVDEIVLSGITPNEIPEVTLLTPTDQESDPVRVFAVGDSTVASYGSNYYPQRGWGQELQHFLYDGAFEVVNRARGGRSSRSYIEEGIWDSLKAELAEGDYVLIQFGHNDRDWSKAERYTPPADYKVYLAQYVNEARALGANPILVTPMVMNAWRDGVMRNVFTESGNDYAGAMKEVAAELSVPLVDLNAKSHAFFSVMDYETAGRYYFNKYEAGEYANFPDGINDGTHFQQMGALLMAKFIAEGFRELEDDAIVGELAAALKAQYPISVKANDGSYGIVTLNTELPEGATVTLKALAAEGHSFVSWKDGDNEAVAATNIHTFEMGREGLTFIAYFDNETAVSAPAPGSKIPAGSNSGSGWSVGDEMLFTADATDPDGSVVKVEYFARNSDNKIGEATEAPYAFVWAVQGGVYEVWAEAVDEHGARGRSQSYLVDIDIQNDAPTVELVSPVNRAIVDAGSNVTIEANAADADGEILRVEFYANGSLLGSDEEAPYALDWSVPEAGTHILGVRAVDNFGEASAVDEVKVSAFFAEGGELLQEAEDGILSGNFVIIDDVAASGGKAVEAFGGSGEDWVEFQFNVEVGGFYQIRALVKAIDGNNDSMFVTIDGDTSTTHTWDVARSSNFINDYVKNRRGEDPVIVLLPRGAHVVRFAYREHLELDQVELELVTAFDGEEVPELSISFTSPADGATFDPGERVEIAADASSTASEIASVQFFLNDALLAEDTEAPFEASIASVEAGLHVLAATAFDEYGFESELVTRSFSAAIEATGGLVQEAEVGDLVGAAAIIDDSAASGGKAVNLPAGDFSAAYAAENYVELRFAIVDAGEYHIRVHLNAIGVQNDSMYVSVDGAPAGQYLFDTASGSGYLEDLVSQRDGPDPVVVNLSEGVHVIRFGARETLSLDKVELVHLGAATHTIYTIGDSTVADYAAGYYPQTGWGQVLGAFFEDEVEVKNRALGGTSSKSYYENHWAPVLAELKEGDFVFIQFGINDRANDEARKTDKETFKAFLTSFVNDSKAVGANPVLVSTVRRNAWNGEWNGGDPAIMYDAYHEHPVATRELAGEIGVPLIDLDLESKALIEPLGSAYAGPFMYMNLAADEYPIGAKADNVHFQEMGAIEMARLVVEGIEALSGDAQVSELIEWIKPSYEVAVSSNDSSMGLVTRTAAYPEGAAVTIKALPNDGYEFVQWEDASGEVVSTERMLRFTMEASARSYHAVFAQGAPDIGLESDATYALVNRGSGLYLQVTSTGSVGGSLSQEARNEDGFQSFGITDLGGGNYAILAKGNGEGVDAYNNGSVGTWTENTGNVNQQWAITLGDDGYRIQTANRGDFVLGVGDGSGAGAGIVWAADTQSAYQRWDFVEVVEADPVTGIFSGASYTIANVGSGLQLQNVSGREITQGVATAAENQKFTITKLDSGAYAITAHGNSENLDAYNGNQTGTWTADSSNANQNWWVSVEDGAYRFESRSRIGNVLSVDGDSVADGANVGWSTDVASDFQRWTLTLVE
ncbi:Ig-like domain-containing protein [Pelagicoccus sp. SDUM812005]|uniref:rhamnogalacturonan lyase family protein n=1 Tax=Pelagicoccus sp. SDUM812005 TaxID=3041257 RepID=UPI00280FAAAB|nr:Ig-like domain-containing protein [Pelagicoccus sp. SDUM812005]MDQ8179026.1 Ig-like domain-containing protein [Pelagicoccus sp. SDUM812005]